MTHNVHLVQSRAPNVQARDNLGRAIAQLAAREKETVWFHDYTNLMCGAPVILLECSDAFLAKVQKIITCASAEVLPAGEQTQRSASIQSYFSKPPQNPRGGFNP